MPRQLRAKLWPVWIIRIACVTIWMLSRFHAWAHNKFPELAQCTITVTSSWARWHIKSPASRLFSQLFVLMQIKESIKIRVSGLCKGNSPVAGEFHAQKASKAKNSSIWWRHHALIFSTWLFQPNKEKGQGTLHTRRILLWVPEHLRPGDKHLR